MISKPDGQIIYKYWETEDDVDLLGGFAGNDKLHLFRSLNQMLPMDLLAAIFVMENPDAGAALDSFYGHVAITDAPLERILCKGVAENHLHIGAATYISTIWEDMMRPDIPLNCMHKNLPVKSPAAPPKPILYIYFLAASCFRMYLAAVVLRGGEDPAPHEHIQAIYPKNLRLFYEVLRRGSKGGDETLEYFQALDKELSEIIQSDPASVLRARDSSRLTEPHFLLEMFRVFQYKKDGDSEHQKSMFLDYLRLNHDLFRMMVQTKTIFGLDYFQLYYVSASGLNRATAKLDEDDTKDR